ncbi:MAG: hypothetical protein ACRENE_16745, partial [Polyangiaceae bacterium]
MLGALVATLVLLLLGLVRALDRPWLKRRIQAAVAKAAGVDLDYAGITIGTRCVAIDGLEVDSPPAVRGVAPVLLRVGRIEACWSPRGRAAPGPALERVTVSHLTLTVVVDETGKTSFDWLSPPGPKSAPEASVPLSRRASVLASAPPVRHAAIDDVELVLICAEGGRGVEHTALYGLAVSFAAEPERDGWRISGGLGSEDAPLDLRLTRERDGSPPAVAHAGLWLALNATSSQARAALDLRVIDQTFFDGVPSVPPLHVEADVAFAPDSKSTTLKVHDTGAGEGTVTTEATVDLPDDGSPRVRHAQGDLDVARLLKWVPAGLVPGSVASARLRYSIDGLVIGSRPELDTGGRASV